MPDVVVHFFTIYDEHILKQKTNNMTQENYKNQFSEDQSVGWEAIDVALELVYPEQEPKHYAPNLPAMLGGEDPLNGISVYKSNVQEPHYHFVTYGFSELFYNEESANAEFSGFGFELTFRLKQVSDDENISWVLNFLQNIAKYVFKTGNWFEPYHLFPANGPIRLDYDTEIVAVSFVEDKELGTIETPNGKVQFLQLVGITASEYEMLKQKASLEAIEKFMNNYELQNPYCITDLDRKN